MTRMPSARAQAIVWLLERICVRDVDHDGIMGSPRILEDLRYVWGVVWMPPGGALDDRA